MSKKPNRRVTCPECTASYPKLDKPDSFEGQAAKYSVTCIFDQGADLSKLEAAIEAAIERGIELKWNGKRPKNLSLPIKDGNEKLDQNDKVRTEYEGRMYITPTASEDDQPEVVDLSLEPVTSAKELYGGMRIRPVVTAFPYSVGGNKGVALYLNRVQKTADGEPFGLVVTAEDDFAD